MKNSLKIISMFACLLLVVSCNKENLINASSEKEILSIALASTKEQFKNENAIVLLVDQSVDVSLLNPKFTLSKGANIYPTAPQDFSKGFVNYTITAEDGSTRELKVFVEKQREKFTKARESKVTITSFGFNVSDNPTSGLTEDVQGQITQFTDRFFMINVDVPAGTDTSRLKPTMIVENGTTNLPDAYYNLSKGLFIIAYGESSYAFYMINVIEEIPNDNDVIKFEDDKFKNALLSNPSIDSNIREDNEITYGEAKRINSIRLSSVNLKNGSRLEDIKYFKNINNLFLSNVNGLESVDFSKNTKLKELVLRDIPDLTTITINKNKSLTNLMLELESSTNLSQNVDFTNLINLEFVKVVNHNIEELDVSNNSQLEYLLVSGRNISKLNIDGLNKLESFHIFNNEKLQSLNLSETSNLKMLSAYDLSELTSLSVNNNIESITIRNIDKIQSLNFSQLNKLKYLSVLKLSGLRNLNLTQSNNMNSFTITNTSITELDLSNKQKLEFFTIALSQQSTEKTLINLKNTNVNDGFIRVPNPENVCLVVTDPQASYLDNWKYFIGSTAARRSDFLIGTSCN